jgi:hypothetical protein
MHGPINVKSPNNTTKWQVEFRSAFIGLIYLVSFSALPSKYTRPFAGTIYRAADGLLGQ